MLIAILTIVATMAQAPSESAVREATRDLLDNPSIQKALPKPPPKEGTGTAAETKKRRDERVRQRRGRRQRRAEPRGFGSSLGSAAMYTLMAIVIGLFIFWIARDLLGFEPDHSDASSEDEPEQERDRGVVERPLGDAETLARQGNYADAVHTLLLRTLMELAHRRGQPLPSSLTSREILARVGLPAAAQVALSEIVDVVEISHFGNLEIGQSDYHRCLESYKRFSEAFLAGAA